MRQRGDIKGFKYCLQFGEQTARHSFLSSSGELSSPDIANILAKARGRLERSSRAFAGL